MAAIDGIPLGIVEEQDRDLDLDDSGIIDLTDVGIYVDQLDSNTNLPDVNEDGTIDLQDPAVFEDEIRRWEQGDNLQYIDLTGQTDRSFGVITYEESAFPNRTPADVTFEGGNVVADFSERTVIQVVFKNNTSSVQRAGFRVNLVESGLNEPWADVDDIPIAPNDRISFQFELDKTQGPSEVWEAGRASDEDNPIAVEIGKALPDGISSDFVGNISPLPSTDGTPEGDTLEFVNGSVNAPSTITPGNAVDIDVSLTVENVGTDPVQYPISILVAGNTVGETTATVDPGETISGTVTVTVTFDTTGTFTVTAKAVDQFEAKVGEVTVSSPTDGGGDNGDGGDGTPIDGGFDLGQFIQENPLVALGAGGAVVAGVAAVSRRNR